ncbi:MAG TPA: YIP1 family protein [Myxococcota bacterium]|nr:YIP1 family protein [Myxococcota bacterium]
MSTLLRRMAGAARLDAATYEEVEADRGSLGQAACVVLAASLVVATARAWHGVHAGFESAQLAFQVLLSALEPLVLWLGGSAFAYMVGASFFRGRETHTDFAEVLRTTGFAFTPALLLALVIVPPASLGLALGLVVRAWTLAALVVAIRQALDFDTPRAIGTFGAAALLLWLVLWGASIAPLPF